MPDTTLSNQVVFAGSTAKTRYGSVDMVPLRRRLDGDRTQHIHDFERDAAVLALYAQGIALHDIATALNISHTTATEVLAGRPTKPIKQPLTPSEKYDRWMSARQTRYAQRVMVDGRLVHPDAVHGTNSSYHSHGCRCVPCCEAHAGARRESLAKRKATR